MQEKFVKFHEQTLRTGFFKNNCGVTFKEIYVISKKNKHISKMYLCNDCGKLLTSKTGASEHNCLIQVHRFINYKLISKHESAMEYILRYIATSNVPYRAMDNENLRIALHFLDSTFNFPGRNTLRNDMIELAQKIQLQTLGELYGKTASLLFDSCKRWGRNYQGIIVYTTKRLYLWSAIPTTDSTALTLANVIASVVGDLSACGVKIVAVCTDNCSANIAALDNDIGSAQDISNIHFIREPCSAHTSNLAIEDAFVTDEEYGFVSDCIKFLMDHAPRGSYRQGFKPKYITIRWLSLYECVSFIVEHMTSYQKTRLMSVKNSLDLIEKKIGWDNLKAILSIMMNFVNSIQKDHSSIADLPPHYLIARSQLLELDVPASHRLAAYLEFRFTNTCPLQLPLFAFLMTSEGLRFFQEDPQEKILEAAIEGLEGYMAEREFSKCMIETNKIAFLYYLNNFNPDEFNKSASAVDFWKNYNLMNSFYDQLSFSFTSIVSEVLQIPCSESAVERLFASLSKIVSSENCNVSPETLNSRLIVKFDSIFSRAGSVSLQDISDNPDKTLKLGKF